MLNLNQSCPLPCDLQGYYPYLGNGSVIAMWGSCEQDKAQHEFKGASCS